MEIILRIAMKRFPHKPGDEQVKLLLYSHIIPNTNMKDNQFRTKQMYNLEVSDVLTANRGGVRKLMIRYRTPK